MLSMFFRFIFCFLVIAVGTEAQNTSSMFSPNKPNPLARSNVALNPGVGEFTVDSNYVLGPGDFLDVFLEDQYFSVQISPDGTMVIDECGVIQAAGKTLPEVREEMLQLVKGRYNPQYSFIQLVQLKKFKVSVMGAVATVGQHLVEPQTRLSFLIRQVGGTLPSADDHNILVVRGSDSIRVNFFAITTEGDFSKDLLLEQGDQIFVPFADVQSSVTLSFANNYRVAVPYNEKRTIKDYFDIAGGLRLHNQGYQSVVIQEPEKKSYTIPFGEAGSVRVPASTQVTFTTQSLFVYVGGATAFTGKVPYEPSWNALDYIAASGVTVVTGSWNQVEVVRGDRERISVNATRDIIMPGDYIEIPKSRYETFKDLTLFLASLLTVVSSALIIYVNYK
jgi:protein involved in polysaccharide export with SLBB domain